MRTLRYILHKTRQPNIIEEVGTINKETSWIIILMNDAYICTVNPNDRASQFVSGTVLLLCFVEFIDANDFE